MIRALSLAAAAALMLLARPVAAQAPRDRPVVDGAWLAQHLHDSDLVLLQVGEQETYDHGHIPGARFADWMTLHAMGGPAGLSLEMPTADQLHDAFEQLGISDRSHVVIYASDEYWSPSTRVVLTLEYGGLSNIAYLDGGLKGWSDAGRPLSKDAPAPKRGTLAPLKLQPVLVDAAFVAAHAHTPGFAVVDARDAAFYTGAKAGGPPTARRNGHIPGALSAPFDQFASGDGQLKSPADMTALFAKAGVKPGDTVIGYCHVGQQATAMLFAAQTLGHHIVLYDGSFEDWAKRGLPVEK